VVGGVSDGPSISPTPLRAYYDALHLLKEQEQTALAKAHAEDPRLLARRFRKSLEALSARGSTSEPFYPPGRKALPTDIVQDRIASTFDFAARLAAVGKATVKDAEHLGFCLVDREIFPTRSTEGTVEARDPRRSLDLLLANTQDGTPIFAELKIRGDSLPYFALIQALMLATELLAPAQRDRLRAHSEKLVWPSKPPYADIYLVVFEAPERGKYRAESLQATAEISERLIRDPFVAQQIRRIAYLQATSDQQGGLEFARIFAVGEGS
jgi:hypothetical protein